MARQADSSPGPEIAGRVLQQLQDRIVRQAILDKIGVELARLRVIAAQAGRRAGPDRASLILQDDAHRASSHTVGIGRVVPEADDLPGGRIESLQPHVHRADPEVAGRVGEKRHDEIGSGAVRVLLGRRSIG